MHEQMVLFKYDIDQSIKKKSLKENKKATSPKDKEVSSTDIERAQLVTKELSKNPGGKNGNGCHNIGKYCVIL